MSHRDTGPPGEGGGPGRQTGPRHHQHRQSLTKNQHPQDNAASQYRGRYGDVWRDGFGHGFRDALRLAARRLPPEAWSVLDKLADDYDLAQ